MISTMAQACHWSHLPEIKLYITSVCFLLPWESEERLTTWVNTFCTSRALLGPAWVVLLLPRVNLTDRMVGFTLFPSNQKKVVQSVYQTIAPSLICFLEITATIWLWRLIRDLEEFLIHWKMSPFFACGCDDSTSNWEVLLSYGKRSQKHALAHH